MKASAVIRGVSVGLLAAAIVGGGFWLAKSGGSRDADSQGAGNTSTTQPLAKNEDEPDETANATASPAATGSAATASPAATDSVATASPAATDSVATASPAATDSAATVSPAATDGAATASPAATGSAASAAPASATQSPETVTFEVKKGEDSATVSQKLEEAGIIGDAEKFNAYLEQTGASGRLHAGTYTFSVGASYPELAKAMAGASK